MSHDVRTLVLLVLVALVAAASAAVAIGAGRRVVRADVAPLARAATAMAASVWVLLVFGASVRVNGAGLACPDWPRCFGELVPDIDWPVFLEFGHRVYAGGESIAFGILAYVVLRRPDLRARMAPWFVAAGAALALQIVLGGLTVLHLLAEWTVASHLVCGNLFSALIAVIAMELWEVASPSTRAEVPGARVLAPALAALVFAQVALGGLVSSSHAGLACGTWPGCNGDAWFPTFAGLVGLQVVHRITAYTLVAFALLAAVVGRGRGAFGRAAFGVAALALAQAALGIANVLLYLPVEVTLLHTGGAAALVLATTAMNHAAFRARVTEPAEKSEMVTA